jgi:hypothetical protein
LLTVCTPEGEELQALSDKIVSKKAIWAFYHYLRAQKDKLLGERGTRIHRQKLVEAHGYDTKFAMHALRLGLQGIELAHIGKITLPMAPRHRCFLLDVRHGRVSLDKVVDRITCLEDALLDCTKTSSLPDEPSRDVVDDWMQEVYWKTWSAER